MKVLVHHPQRVASVHELRQKVAVIHADAILQYIQQLSCPQEQKLKLIEIIKNLVTKNTS